MMTPCFDVHYDGDTAYVQAASDVQSMAASIDPFPAIPLLILFR